MSNTPQTSFQYSGANGSNYQFRAQASNNNGASFGPWSADHQHNCRHGGAIDNHEPAAAVHHIDFFLGVVDGSDSGGSGVAPTICNLNLDGGAWQTLISNTPQTSFYFQNAQTGLYGFRVQAVDNAGNVQAWPASAQASTTVLVNPLAVVQPFNPPILQSTAPVTKSFNVSWKGYAPPGSYLTTYTVTYRYNSGPWTSVVNLSAHSNQRRVQLVQSGTAG